MELEPKKSSYQNLHENTTDFKDTNIDHPEKGRKFFLSCVWYICIVD